MKFPRFFLILCLASTAWSAELPDLGESAQADLSPQMEKRIGESIMNDIRLRDAAYLDDPEVEGYLNRLGRRLAAKSDDLRQDFEFFAIRDASLNAFAMPGGYIGVHTGLILAAQSESELTGVLAHEISHVTQRHLARLFGKQSQAQLASLLTMAVAILAARNRPDLAQGAIVAGQAAGIQSQLGYTRDFEREADRIGIQILERAGYDIRGMASFFERMQRYSRLYENNAPGYLRTHPLTTERISDMENRIQERPYRQVPDSLDFLLVRAKLRAQEGTPQDAVADFESQVRERKFASEAGARYGLARAYLRAKRPVDAEREVAALRRLGAHSALIEALAAECRIQQNDPAGAAAILRAALTKDPGERALAYGFVEALLASRRMEEAFDFTAADLQTYPGDARMHALQAKSAALLGRRLQQHRAQAEVYALRGQLLAAIEQLQFAQRAPDGNFYERSQVDARLRELKARQAEEAKQRRSPSGF